jgi:hypothetical protein
MSHAGKADKLPIKPAAGARPAPPHTRGQIIPKAHTKRPVTRRVTRGTATTRLAMVPDRPQRESHSPLEAIRAAERSQRRRMSRGDRLHDRDRRRTSPTTGITATDSM